MNQRLKISDYILKMISRHGEREYPHEACGVVIGPKDKALALGVFPITNIQDNLHQKDPVQYPRDAKTAYFMEPKELRILEKEIKGQDFEIKIYYHSHPDHEVYFSDEDKALACPWGEPSYPGVSHLVVSVIKGKAVAAGLFHWDDRKKDFCQRPLK